MNNAVTQTFSRVYLQRFLIAIYNHIYGPVTNSMRAYMDLFIGTHLYHCFKGIWLYIRKPIVTAVCFGIIFIPFIIKPGRPGAPTAVSEKFNPTSYKMIGPNLELRRRGF